MYRAEKLPRVPDKLFFFCPSISPPGTSHALSTQKQRCSFCFVWRLGFFGCVCLSSWLDLRLQELLHISRPYPWHCSCLIDISNLVIFRHHAIVSTARRTQNRYENSVTCTITNTFILFFVSWTVNNSQCSKHPAHDGRTCLDIQVYTTRLQH